MEREIFMAGLVRSLGKQKQKAAGTRIWFSLSDKLFRGFIKLLPSESLNLMCFGNFIFEKTSNRCQQIGRQKRSFLILLPPSGWNRCKCLFNLMLKF